VAENGRRLADLGGAHRDIVTLFAYLHDACRASEDWDPERGPRSAQLAARWRGTYFDLSRQNFDLLYTACAAQGDGLLEGDITLQTCWDAIAWTSARQVAVIPSRLCTRRRAAVGDDRMGQPRAGTASSPSGCSAVDAPATPSRYLDALQGP
jgi:hypothetical protein